MAKEKTKVEFEYTELNDNDIIKVGSNFFRLVNKRITDWKDRSYDRVFLNRIKDLKELQLEGSI